MFNQLLLQISYACTLDSLSSKEAYSTFARTVSSSGANAVPMTNIVQHMKWERIGIIYRNINLFEVRFIKQVLRIFAVELSDSYFNLLYDNFIFIMKKKF